ncbi:hypothetical protein [Rhodococcus sp. UNC363MFTsu5.1]|uniref:hypothetical protein n=1 Tax=Rhodococcus sp. UNC363MFTsu5.1 TaxID=1449069 RepID=UPI00068CDD83|nr:hypothetical protein [Rhodococcus sp. UNC363MFTsu5.1]
MTSNEIAPLTEGDILPAGASLAVTPDAAGAIGQLMQHAQAMDIAYKLAESMCKTALVPAIYRGKPEDGTAAILYGAELGLNPIQSLQQIFVVHGSPAIYARTMVALLKTRGFLLETVATADDSVTVRGTDPSTGQVEESTWTYERARKAGYTTNKKYDTDPQAMLYAKAATEVCRKIAPDVLLGIAHTREELELEPIRATVERVTPTKRGVAALDAALGIAAPAADPEPASDSGAKVDIAQASEPEPEVAMATPEQQKRVGELLTAEKLDTRKQKLDYLEGQFGRKFTSAANLTAAEADQLIAFLADAQAADAQAQQ